MLVCVYEDTGAGKCRLEAKVRFFRIKHIFLLNQADALNIHYPKLETVKLE